jgi:hypothetical protein
MSIVIILTKGIFFKIEEYFEDLKKKKFDCVFLKVILHNPML